MQPVTYLLTRLRNFAPCYFTGLRRGFWLCLPIPPRESKDTNCIMLVNILCCYGDARIRNEVLPISVPTHENASASLFYMRFPISTSNVRP